VPSPFAVLPGGERVAIYVPESNGIFLMEGERILHHLPVSPTMESVHDLAASESLLVAGSRPSDGRNTARLEVFDVATGKRLVPVVTGNPHLRVAKRDAHLWRVVVRGSRVGVYQPALGATVPLWDRAAGFVTSEEQIRRMRAGVSLDRAPAWVPTSDGRISYKERGHTREVAGAEAGLFLDGFPNGDLLLLEPTDVADLPGEEGILLPPVLRLRHWHGETAITELRLSALDPRVHAERLIVHGRPVRERDGRIYWIAVGHDYLEIRSLRLSESRLDGSAP
jgi:hypothetical protein